MGFNDTPLPHFPVNDRLVYLNHASVAPLCPPAAQAMQALAQDCLENGSQNYSAWLKTYESLRVRAARLIQAHRDEIAIVKNTSEGVATVALGIDWRPGDRIVGFLDEFPANSYPWKRLAARGVSLTWLAPDSPLEAIDEACRGARLLAISFVQYISGFRANLNAIGEICRRRGVFFFVDAIQGLGAFPLDVEAAGIDALAADGHKWLLGPEGCGILYVRRSRLDEIEPVEFGWTNVADYNAYNPGEIVLRPDAGRYECGTLNTIGCYGLDAAFGFLLDIGVENITPRIEALASRLAAGATERGYELMAPRTPETGSGIVSFRKPGVDTGMLVARLHKQGISVANRRGWLRVSPHFYIPESGVDRLLEALP